MHTSVFFVHPTHMPLISMQPRIQTLPKDFGRCKPYTVRCPYFCVCAFNPRKNSESDLNLPCTSYFDIMQLDMSGPRTMTVSHQAHLSTHSHYYRPPLSLPYENKNKGWLTYHLYVGIITPSFLFLSLSFMTIYDVIDNFLIDNDNSLPRKIILLNTHTK